MLKHFLFIFFVTFSTIIFAQDGEDPGFGDEGLWPERRRV